MTKPRRTVTLYYFQDGPKQFHTKEEQTVDAVAVGLGLEVQWLNARDRSCSPLLMTFNITELPVLVARTVAKQGGVASSSYRTFAGAELKNPLRLTRRLTALKEAQ